MVVVHTLLIFATAVNAPLFALCLRRPASADFSWVAASGHQKTVAMKAYPAAQDWKETLNFQGRLAQPNPLPSSDDWIGNDCFLVISCLEPESANTGL
jgi:hypothetical protein